MTQSEKARGQNARSRDGFHNLSLLRFLGCVLLRRHSRILLVPQRFSRVSPTPLPRFSRTSLTALPCFPLRALFVLRRFSHAQGGCMIRAVPRSRKRKVRVVRSARNAVGRRTEKRNAKGRGEADAAVQCVRSVDSRCPKVARRLRGVVPSASMTWLNPASGTCLQQPRSR